MPHPMLRWSLLAVALAGPGCLLPPEIVGSTITTSAGGETDKLPGSSASATLPGEGLTSTSGSEPSTSATTGPAGAAYGSACELVGLGPDIQFTSISPQPSCEDGICLLVYDQSRPGCASDLQCTDEDDGPCADNGVCNLSPAFLEANARCTRTCESVADCPPIPGCQTGLTCGTMTVLGELCCQRVCACNDLLEPAAPASLDMLCALDPEQCS